MLLKTCGKLKEKLIITNSFPQDDEKTKQFNKENKQKKEKQRKSGAKRKLKKKDKQEKSFSTSHYTARDARVCVYTYARYYIKKRGGCQIEIRE